MKKLLFFLLCVDVVIRCNAGQQLSPPYTCTTTVCKPGSSISSATHHSWHNQGPPGKRGGVGQKGDKGDPCHCDVADEEAIQSLRSEWRNQVKQYENIVQRLNELEDFPENCSSRHKSGSLNGGEDNSNRIDIVPIYPLKFIGDVTPWMMNCTKILSEGTDGWISIQRRQDGGTDFFRNWESYAKGFGNSQEEFWLGLRNIHKMTSTRSCKLRIEMKRFDGREGYAEYNEFKVADEESNFRLRISGFSGNVPDSMAHHNGQGFSSIDRDNDDHPTYHCAKGDKGPWWHGRCFHSNLNGIYQKMSDTGRGLVRWNGFEFSSSLPFVEMKVHCM